MLDKAVVSVVKDEVNYLKVKEYKKYVDVENPNEYDIVEVSALNELSERNDLWLKVDESLKFDEIIENELHVTNVEEKYESFETLLVAIKGIQNDLFVELKKYEQLINRKFTKESLEFIEQPIGVFHANYNRVTKFSYSTVEEKLLKLINKSNDPIEKYNLVKEHSKEMLLELRTFEWSDCKTKLQRERVQKDIETILLNVRNFRFAANKCKNIDLKTKLFSTDIAPHNFVTMLPNNAIRAEKVAEQIQTNLTTKRSIGEVVDVCLNERSNADYNNKIVDILAIEDKEKAKKQKQMLKAYSFRTLFTLCNGLRPFDGLAEHEYWSGLQTFDLDIKFDDAHIQAEDIKQTLHNSLLKFHWYIGVKSSISGNGLHIITKVTPPHKLSKDNEINKHVNFYWHRVNYYQKYCVIKWLLLNECNISHDTINEVIDKSMMRIHQGLVLNYDPNFMLNDNFADLPMLLGFNIPPKDGLKESEWLLLEENLKYIFTKKRKKNKIDNNGIQHKIVQSFDTPDVKINDKKVNAFLQILKVSDIKAWDFSKYEKGQRDMERSKILRTAIYVFGSDEKIYNSMRKVLEVGTVFSEQEFIGKWRYGCRKSKFFVDSMNILKRCGLDIDIDINIDLIDAAKQLNDSIVDVDELSPNVVFELSEEKPYLSMIMGEMFRSFKSDKINLIESAPGTGKTHLFNELAKKKTILLVEPYVSVLKNKTEEDDVYSKLFDVCYGKKPINITQGQSVATTFDKFSRLNLSDLKNFDLIAIDESHLLFTSNYREKVTSTTLRKCREFVEEERKTKTGINFSVGMFDNMSYMTTFDTMSRKIDNMSTKIIMMTGTITGELSYFGKLNLVNYIQIRSKHKYGKHLECRIVQEKSDKRFAIIKTIAENIKVGKVVIVPTNEGNAKAEYIIDGVNLLLGDDIIKDTEWAYYKKSESLCEVNENINKNSKVTNELKLLFCTVYLGVGVDILNDKEFCIIYNSEDFTVHDIEQFNNRIRRTKIESIIVYHAFEENMIRRSFLRSDCKLTVQDVSELEGESQDDYRIAKVIHNISAKNPILLETLPDFMKLTAKYHYVNQNEVLFDSDRYYVNKFSKTFSITASKPAYVRHIAESNFGYIVDCVPLSTKVEQSITERLQRMETELMKKLRRERTKAFKEVYEFVLDKPYLFLDKNSYEIVNFFSREFSFEVIPQNGDVTIIKVSQSFDNELRQAIKLGLVMSERYKQQTAMLVLNNRISDDGLLNQKEFTRDLKLMEYLWRGMKSETNKLAVKSFNLLNQTIDELINDDILSDTENVDGVIHTTEIGLETILSRFHNLMDDAFKDVTDDTLKMMDNRTIARENILEFIKTFMVVKRRKDDIKLNIRMIPEFDSDTIKKREEFDTYVRNFMAKNLTLTKSNTTTTEHKYEVGDSESLCTFSVADVFF